MHRANLLKRLAFSAQSLFLLIAISSAQAASLPAVEAKNGMVVTSQHLASQVGVDILKMGGNAIDAAVAVGYAQAVVNPCCGNIGGGGFMTITASIRRPSCGRPATAHWRYRSPPHSAPSPAAACKPAWVEDPPNSVAVP